jgi:hypothetical protein
MNKSKDNPLPETKNDPRQVSFQLQSLQLQMSLPRFSNKTLKNFIIIFKYNNKYISTIFKGK